MPRLRISSWALAVGLTFAPLSEAQVSASGSEMGRPFSISFDYQAYDGHSQNWAAVQDPRGIMYFGNSNGVMIFDGVNWRTIPVANFSIARSLDVDESGTVFVGAVNELGFLSPDDTGSLTYISLLPHLDPEERQLGDVWRTYAIGDSIYFWTAKKLFRWRQNAFQSWPVEGSLVCCRAGDRILYNRRGDGLQILEDDRFLPLVGSEPLGELAMVTLLPYDDQRILVGVRDGRLWLLSWSKVDESGALRAELTGFPTEVDEELARHKLYTGARLADGSFALATMTGGSLILDRQGRLLHHFNRSHGLLDDSVWDLYVDREGGLWHSLNRGLARVELGTPVTAFGEISQLDGTVEALTRFQGALHMATSLGLYRLKGRRIERTSSLEAPYWSLLPILDEAAETEALLVGATRGVYLLEDAVTGESLRELVPARNAFHLYRSLERPQIVYFGDMHGVGILEQVDGEWIDAGRLEGVDQEVRSLAEDDDGHLWLGTHFDGLMRLTLAPQPKPRVVEVRRLGLEHGLPTLKSVKVQRHFGQILVVSSGGLMRFNEQAERFEPDDLLGPEGQDLSIMRFRTDAAGNAWMSLFEGELAVGVRQPDGSYDLDINCLRRLAGSATHALLPEAEDVVWLGGVDGLYRFEAGQLLSGAYGDDRLDVAATSRSEDRTYAAWVRRVSVARPGGAVLYDGARMADWQSPTLAYEDGSLRFEYSLPRFDGMHANRFRSRLIGLGETWSDWTDETYRDFTALREGRYRFEVEGRDIYYRPSAVASFDFRVLPPWYRTWWAYALYALALASTTWTLIAWLLRRARLEMEVRRLAESNQLMRRNEEERKQFVSELESKNREMERFIYTVSHDLKSPLISIRGFLGMLEKDMTTGAQDRVRHDMERINAATGKMVKLVDELLELSKIGRQARAPETVVMAELAREAADQVVGLIDEHEVEIVISPDLPTTQGDRQRILALLQNLIENAVKYMGDQASPRVEIDHRSEGGETIYLVRDNGMGIDPRYQKKIFDIFERLSAATEGTGVGLALVKRIVEVHGGRVWVESEGEGHGSTFCFTLTTATAAA